MKAVIICALLFISVTMPFREFFRVMEITEMRPAAALPPVLGLMLGWKGALGCALGNFVADLLSGYGLVLSVVSFPVQFIYGIVPWLIWKYIKKRSGSGIPFFRLNNVRNVIWYIGVMAGNSILMAAMLGAIFVGFGFSGFFSYATLMVLFNNFVFSIMLGIPIIIVMTLRMIKTINKKFSLNERMALIFLMTAVIVSVMVGVFTYMYLSQTAANPLTMWINIYSYVTSAMLVMLIFAIGALQYAEKKITMPLETLAGVAKNYTVGEQVQLAAAKCEELSIIDNEAGTLAQSFHKMILRSDLQIEQLRIVTAEQEQITAELNVATNIQASMLPRNFLDIMFSAAFTASFIPIFSSYLETKGKRAAFDLAALFISVVLVLTGVVVIVSIFLAGPIFNLSVGDYDLPYGTEELGVQLLRMMFPLMILSGLAFSFTGILQSLGEFRIPAAMSIVSNGVILIYYFFFIDRFGVHGLVIAFLLGWAAQGIVQVPFLIRHKFKFRFRLDFKDEGLRQVGILALPVLASSWILPVNLMVNARASAGLYGGVFGINSIHYAHSLYTIISGVFILSVANVIFPKLSRFTAAGDDAGFRDIVNKTMQVLFFFLLPLTFGLMALSHPLVDLIYGRREFCETAVEITGIALFYFAIGILGYGLLVILTRACYARKDGKTPIIAAVAAILVNGVLSFALAPSMYIAGPALANAIGNSIGALVLVVALTGQGVLVWSGKVFGGLAKMAALAVIMFLVVIFVYDNVQDMHLVLQVLLPALAGGVVYLGGGVVFGSVSQLRFTL